MGTPYQLKEPPRDLKVTLQDKYLVLPSEQTERKSMYLSNIDQVLNFHFQTVHFFRAHGDYPPDVLTERIKNGLSRVLVAYDFLAGRLRLSNGGERGAGRLEIDCDGSGVGFVVASSEYTLEEIGDLVFPNPAFRQLIVQGSSLDDLRKDGDLPLCIFQVTSFKCGGFAIGMSSNHTTLDGISIKIFLENLASQSADKPYLAITPCNDRRLLAARSPPQVTFPHPELLKLEIPAPGSGPDQTIPSVFECPQDPDLDFKIFRLTSADISSLKTNAKSGTTTNNHAEGRITSFNAVTAHVWRCRALSSSQNPDRLSTVLYAVDIRPRLDLPLPQSYTGNAVLTTYATATVKELEELPLSMLVEVVSEGARRMTDEYARSAIDWGELYKGFPHGDFLVSSWWRLGFGQVEYPWGKPRYSCPVVHHRKDIIVLFPDIEDDDDEQARARAGGGNGNGNGGVNVLVALPHGEMLVFEKLFRKFLACTM